MCAAGFDPGLARAAGVIPGGVLVTRDPAAAAGSPGARLAVLERPHGGQLPARGDRQLTVLALTLRPGYLRSSVCIQVQASPGTRGQWARAERLWQHGTPPGPGGPAGTAVCLGPDALAQEILHIASRQGIVDVRGNWYSYRDRRIGNSWKAAARTISGDADLREQLLGKLVRLVPLYPGWRHVYA